MDYYSQLNQQIIKLINQQLGQSLAQVDDLVLPPTTQLADLSWPCFRVAQQLGQSPVQLAQQLAEQLALVSGPEITSWQAVGPYLNIVFNASVVAKPILSAIIEAGNNYGRSSFGAGRKIMVEFSNANTHKDYHIGHLRNLFFGDSVSRLLEFTGHQVVPVSYLNDFGIHVAKVLWKLAQIDEKELPSDNLGQYLGQLYVQANQELADNPTGQQAVNQIMKQLEAQQSPSYDRWQITRQWSLDQFNQIYQELDINFQHTFFESDYLLAGRQLVQDLLASGQLIKSQGAVLADLEDDNLGVLLFLRSDGTALYPVADLVLAQDKFDQYQLTESWYVIDQRQSLYMQQLITVLGRLGFNQPIRHLAYNFVKLPTGLMASRQGNVITHEALKQALLEQEIIEIKNRHPEWSSDQQQTIAWQVVVGALKFEMLKVGPDKPITFDLQQSLSFDGYTAAYIQYTAVRLVAILRQATKSSIVTVPSDLTMEQPIILSLARFGQVVNQATKQTDPSVLTKYLFELAQQFNDYYHQVRILGSVEQDFRLFLAQSLLQVFTNGLNLLGIKTPELM